MKIQLRRYTLNIMHDVYVKPHDNYIIIVILCVTIVELASSIVVTTEAIWVVYI